MPVIKLDDGQAESLRGILAEVLDMDVTYAELQPVYEALVAWEFSKSHELLYSVEDLDPYCGACGALGCCLS